MAEVENPDEERRRREEEAEAAMERMMLEQEALAAAQEQQEEDDDVNNNNNNNAAADELAPGMIPEEPAVDPAALREQHHPAASAHRVSGKLSYRQVSVYSAVALLLYAFRTREQYYLAAVYLSTSKWAYVVFGNALIALLITIFDSVCGIFLGGLRLQEAEGLQDFFRWNVTETCLALTMFRAELTVKTAVEFLILIMVKCLHHTAILREQHLRMTEDALEAYAGRWPMLRQGHRKLLSFLLVLQVIDLAAAQYTVQHLLDHGPSVNILFAFEAAILLVSAWSHLLLWYLHVIDSFLHFGHDHSWPAFRRFLHPWREYKATMVFAVELQAQTVQFLFYLTFFAIVLTYYGMPINLFREVYMSFAALKERLAAFFKYRRLMAGMNGFKSATAEELEEAGRVCIICRDDMTVHDCKRLPVCHHVFHKSCLREWLVQQQTCPTCRSDITSMQAQETAAQAAAQRQEQQQQQQVLQRQQQPDGIIMEEEEEEEQQQQGEPELLDVDDTGDYNDTAQPRRDKKVRFTAPDATPMSPSSPLPKNYALYKVIQDAPVLHERQVVKTVRTIPSGVLVLFQGQTMVYKGQRHLRIPDGWIPETCTECVYKLESSR